MVCRAADEDALQGAERVLDAGTGLDVSGLDLEGALVEGVDLKWL